MTASFTPAGKAVFDLLKPFAESGDARLRGNAAYAYAALAESSDAETRDRARDRLIALVGADIDTDAERTVDWERRFVSRVFDALAHLPPEQFRLAWQTLVQRSEEGDSPAQQRVYARFLLSLNEDLEHRQSLGWLRTLRLMWRAGRPKIGWSVWAAVWRCFSVWLAIFLIASMLQFDLTKDKQLDSLFYLSLAGSLLVALGSVGGQFLHRRRIMLVDVLLCGSVFGLMSLGSLAIIDIDPSATAWSGALTTGVLLGVVLRLRRWSATTLRVDYFRAMSVWEPFVAFCFATLLCIVASLTTGESGALGAAWAVIAPTAGIANWLDEWLARKAAQPLRLRKARPANAWVTIVPAVALVVAASAAIYFNYKRAVGGDPLSLKREPIKLPERLDGGADYMSTVALGAHLYLDVTRRSSFRITASPSENDAHAVEINVVAPSNVLDPKSVTSAGEGPAIMEYQFPPGRYDVCLSPPATALCVASPMKTWAGLGAALMSGSAMDVSLARRRPRVAIAMGGTNAVPLELVRTPSSASRPGSAASAASTPASAG